MRLIVQKLITSLITVATARKRQSFAHAIRNPEVAQQTRWLQIHGLLSQGAFWKEQFSAGHLPKNLSEFEIRDFEDYRAAFAKSQQTGRSELTGEEILYWCKTSGTSGARKLFPLTQSFLDEFQMGGLTQLHSLATTYPKALTKPVLFVGATRPEEKSPTGLDVGYISYWNYSRMPKAALKQFAFPVELMRDEATFVKWSPLYALATNLGVMAAITPSRLILMAERIVANLESYWPYLEGKPMPEGLPRLNVSLKRLIHLRETLRAGEPFLFTDVWPSLQYVTTWKSSSCKLQLDDLRKWIGPNLPIIEGAYSSTEACLTVGLARERAGNVLNVESHICEFLPEGAETKKENLIQAWDLKVGGRYEVVLTTSMGLVRYRLKDIIECVGFEERAPLIEFAAKQESMVVVGHSRLSEEFLLRALEDSGIEGQFKFAPSPDGRSLVIYSTTAQNDLAVSRVSKRLAELIPVFKEDLKSGLMAPMKNIVLPCDHVFWAQATHAQAKLKIVATAPPSDARAA